MFKNTEIAQILQGGLIRPFQYEENIWGQKKVSFGMIHSLFLGSS